MKKLVALAAAFALAACGGEADIEEVETDEELAAGEDGSMLAGEEPGFEAVAPGTYEVVHANGEVDTLTIHPGMTWSMVFANGDAAGGTLFMQDGQTCFVTEGEEGQDCFTGTEPAEDGSIESTGTTGETMTVRPAGQSTQVPQGSEI